MTQNNGNTPETNASQIDNILLYETSDIDEDDLDGATAAAILDTREELDNFQWDPGDNGARTQFSSDSGYFMRWVPDGFEDLHFQDILTLPDLRSYPVSQESYESLPPEVQATLEKKGHAKINTIYLDHVFHGATLGWDDEPSVTTFFQDAIREGASANAVLDYYMVEIAGDADDEEDHSIESWANTRDVTTEAVKRNLDRVEKAGVQEPTTST